MKGEKVKVLLFDDDADILELCTVILSSKGYDVVTSSTCENLLHTVELAQPDIIFMDNWIPVTGGIVATRELKSHPTFKNIPVIYFSANNNVPGLAEEAGADAYLAKPFDIVALEEIIGKTLDGKII